MVINFSPLLKPLELSPIFAFIYMEHNLYNTHVKKLLCSFYAFSIGNKVVVQMVIVLELMEFRAPQGNRCLQN